jgi:hypothetical protein
MIKRVVAAAVLAILATASQVYAVDGYKDTPILPGTPWHVHDPDRPQPPVITPGAASTQDAPGQAPSDATVLFGGNEKDLANWQQENGKPTQWTFEDGAMVVKPGTGQLVSKQQFGDCQVHVEFCEPSPGKGSSQGRGNSGVFLMNRYEVQVLDCYQNVTYADGTTGAIYGQHPPYVNACRPPGQWETYDILWQAPRFDGDKLVTPAYETVILNGVVVQNHTELLGPTVYRQLAHYSPQPPIGPLGLQDHGAQVRYRNIWVRPMMTSDEAAAQKTDAAKPAADAGK